MAVIPFHRNRRDVKMAGLSTAHAVQGTHIHWRRNRGARGACAPPHFSEGGQRYVCAPPPHFQTQNLGLGIEPTDICDVTLAWLASDSEVRQRTYIGRRSTEPDKESFA